jgi:hypothetical protein
MTLYYTLVFALLVLEMGMFMLLIIPLPFNVKRKIFTYVQIPSQKKTPSSYSSALSKMDTCLN